MHEMIPLHGPSRELENGEPHNGRPALRQLADWAYETHEMSAARAVTLGFPVGSAEGRSCRRVLLFSVSRSTNVAGANGTVYRFGVALRALVTINDGNLGGALTLPSVAAKVELQHADASAQLLVCGFNGDGIAHLLPGWRSFGVDAYATYMRSVSMIQRRMAAEPHHLVPELLGMTGTPPMPTPPAAMGLLYALDAIRHRQCLAVALTRLPRQDSGLHDAVRAAYLDRVAGDELAEPDAHAVETARAELGQIRLRRGWPRYRRRP